MPTLPTLKVYYWPMLLRGASLVRMLEHTKTPYTYISDKAEMAKMCSTWGATGTTFAPPVVVDGDYVLSQSTATCLYLGKKLGLTPPGFDEFKASQFCSDIVDTFEGGLGKNNEDGPTLKQYVEGPRFAAQMSNIERSIVGPYYFGAAPSAVDFFLLQHLDWRQDSIFGPLKVRRHRQSASNAAISRPRADLITERPLRSAARSLHATGRNASESTSLRRIRRSPLSERACAPPTATRTMARARIASSRRRDQSAMRSSRPLKHETRPQEIFG